MKLEELRARLRAPEEQIKPKSALICVRCSKPMRTAHAHPIHGITCIACARQYVYDSPHDDPVADELFDDIEEDESEAALRKWYTDTLPASDE